ncbi:hypothetical protein P8452_16553 [Trifolium repens]|nr:hypothetical protein P8452_16553 [Trifolium repens]
MEATVRALDEQKSELEKVIAALKKEEAEEEGLVAENASDNVAGDGVDAAVGDAADHNVDKEEGDTEELELSDSSASVALDIDSFEGVADVLLTNYLSIRSNTTTSSSKIQNKW